MSSSWPFTRLHFGCGRCVAISGPHIQVYDATSGQVLATARCKNVVSCSAVDEKYGHLVTTEEDKNLSVWEINNSLQLKSSRELPKKATVVQLSHDAQTIIVADKFGDVFSYPIDPPPGTVTTGTFSHSSQPRPKDAQASHENPHGTLILGHASIITSLLLSHDGHYIITADRDEHIRVSRYPQGYNIERYCLGHRLFVSAMCIPSFDPSSLVSGGGDPTLNIWDWMSGTLKYQLPIADTVRPFLKVSESKHKWHREKNTPDGARGRKGRGRGKKATATATATEGGGTEEVVMQITEPLAVSDKVVTTENTSEESHVLALSKIKALEFKNEKLLVFSAIGGSALFYCAYPSQADHVPPVKHIDFLCPVLDFVLGEECQVLVSVDSAWPSPLAQEGTERTAMRLIEWAGEFKPVETPSPLLSSMNGTGSQKATTAAELSSLQLYSDLALLPKHADGPEEGDGVGGDGDSEFSRAELPEHTRDDGKGQGPQQYVKAVGRMKTKRSLLRKQVQAQVQALDKSGSSRSASGDERETKKAKIDQSERG